MIEIRDIDDERIAFYRSLRYTPKLHTVNRVFVAEEEKVVVKLLKSDIEVLSLFGTQKYLERHAELIESRNISQDKIYYADISLMKQIVGYRLHSGFMAIGKQPDDIILEQLPSPVIILNALANAENVGSIVRNAAAFGFRSIIWDEASVSPYLRRSVRVSMGNVFKIKVHHTKSIVDTLNILKIRNHKIIAIEITDNSIPIQSYQPENKNYCLIFGSEGKGVSPEVLAMSDKVIYIPISEYVPSLNVASSSAVILNHFSQL